MSAARSAVAAIRSAERGVDGERQFVAVGQADFVSGKCPRVVGCTWDKTRNLHGEVSGTGAVVNGIVSDGGVRLRAPAETWPVQKADTSVEMTTESKVTVGTVMVVKVLLAL